MKARQPQARPCFAGDTSGTGDDSRAITAVAVAILAVVAVEAVVAVAAQATMVAIVAVLGTWAYSCRAKDLVPAAGVPMGLAHRKYVKYTSAGYVCWGV